MDIKDEFYFFLNENIKNLSDIKVDEDWFFMYDIAQKYFKVNRNLKVNYYFRTINGYDYDETGYPLGKWIECQKYAYRNRFQNSGLDSSIQPLSDHQVKLLNKIGMVYDISENFWNSMYKLASKYYEVNGNLLVPNDFVTENGYESSTKGYMLGKWMADQRKNLRGRVCNKNNDSTTQTKIYLLNKIGMVYSLNEHSWIFMYELAKKYYEKYANLRVPLTFKTKDGYTYSPNGYNLGEWIESQRKEYQFKDTADFEYNSLNMGRIKLLNKIGMIYDINNNIELQMGLCRWFKADININKDFILNVPHEETLFKIDCLRNNNVPICIDGVMNKDILLKLNEFERKYCIDNTVEKEYPKKRKS